MVVGFLEIQLPCLLVGSPAQSFDPHGTFVTAHFSTTPPRRIIRRYGMCCPCTYAVPRASVLCDAVEPIHGTLSRCDYCCRGTLPYSHSPQYQIGPHHAASL